MGTPMAQQCRVCRQRTAEYTCPRCNARYCSVDCYKQHSERCTEGFYRDAAVAELRGITAGEDEKRHMVDILQRLYQQELEGGSGSGSDDEGQEEEGEEEGELSMATLHRLLEKMQASGGELDDLDVSAEDLSPAELAAFHRALAAGELSDTVQPWQPWWLTEEAARLELGAGGTALVEAAGPPATGSGEPPDSSQQPQQGQEGGQVQRSTGGPGGQAAQRDHSMLPAPPSRPLPPLAALTRAPPSPLLQYQLLDLLYSYCLVLQRYNGDYQWEAAEAADLLFAVSAVLAAVAPAASGSGSGAGTSTGGADASDVASAAAPVLLACLQRACLPSAGGAEGRSFAVAVLADVAAVLQLGRPAVLTALMDASRLVEAARRQVEESSDAAGGKQNKELRRRLVAAERKLLFFLAWANEQPTEAYELLALAAAKELQKHGAAMDAGRAGQAGPTAAPAVGSLGAVSCGQLAGQMLGGRELLGSTVVASQEQAGQPRVLVEELA